MLPLPLAPRATPPAIRMQAQVLVLYANTNELTEKTYAAKLQQLPLFEQERIGRQRRRSDRYGSLLGRLLLIEGLEHYGHTAEALADLHFTTYGKPFLPALPLDFNISHADPMVVCALANSCRVGIDIEPLRQLPLAEVSTTADARQWQDILAADDPSARFLNYWTRKEAIVKCRGEGLSLPLAAISGTTSLQLDGESWQCQELRIAQGFICHGAAKSVGLDWRLQASQVLRR